MMLGRRLGSWRAVDALAVGAAAVAVAFMGQTVNANSASHLALVRALADGTPFVDKTSAEVPYIGPLDVFTRDGHRYSNKAPGLAFVTLPAYLALEAAGVRTTGDPTLVLWVLGILGTVLPVTLVMMVVRGLAEKLQPGYGTATAVTLGLGTLLLPFGTMFFAHPLSAALCIAAFALLWHERERGRGPRAVVVAGFLAGYAVTTEYPNALVALVLGLYALTSAGRLRRALRYSAGVLFGVLPLALFNAWAFGSPLTHSYQGGRSSRAGEDPWDTSFGLFGLHVPSPVRCVEVLFTHWGLLWASPILGLGALGAVTLARRGQRAEAAVVGAVPTLFVLYNAAFWGPVGGGAAGTRYLIPMLPFVAFPVALVFARLPLTGGAFAAVSVGLMTLMTATGAVIAWDGHVLDRLTSADGSPRTVADFVGVTGWYDLAPFYVFVFVAVLAAVASVRGRVDIREVPLAVVALLGWTVTAVAGSGLLTTDTLAPSAAALVVLLVAIVAIATAAAAGRLGRPQPANGVADLR